MRNSRDYNKLRYATRARVHRGHEGPKYEFWLLVLVFACLVGAARLDYLTQRDCGDNTTCLERVMP